jgi:ferrous iron transport protein B
MSDMEKTQPHSPPPPSEDILQLAKQLRWKVGQDFHEKIIESIYAEASRIAERAVKRPEHKPRWDWDQWLDKVLTSRLWGFPIMLALFSFMFWLTISGANIPSAWLNEILVGKIQPFLHSAAAYLSIPQWISGLFIDGIYLTTAWVVSVMLPPMAIFFPLFTLLEDFGYLPRIAFNLDNLFKKAGAHGKQSMSMMMGFGCNAAGVVATRIIDSPRERLIAIITNNFSLCNGRWPTQILLATIFVGAWAPSYLTGIVAASAVVTVALLGIFLAFLFSWALSRTVLRGQVSTFSLELPPYRPPRLGLTLYTSLIDRTLFVLWRAIVFAAPAGAVIWLVANVQMGNQSLAEHIIHWLNPVGAFFGLNGVILLAYLIAIPANEIVVPTILMLTALTVRMSGVGDGAGVIFEAESDAATLAILKQGGWTLLTAMNVMLFSLMHNPCSTTIYTIYKESGSLKWTVVATVLPIILGLLTTFAVTTLWRHFS